MPGNGHTKGKPDSIRHNGRNESRIASGTMDEMKAE